MAMSGSGLNYIIQDLCFSYGSLPCLDDINLTLEPGFLYGLVGPNGSGKSTLLDLMSGHLRLDSGTISLKGKLLDRYSKKELAKCLTSVPQSFSFNFDFVVYDVVLMGRHPYIGKLAAPNKTDHLLVQQALELMGVEHLRDRSIRKLSGGEKQRVMIARALTQDTEIVLLDEVTANLDINHGISIMKTMAELVSQGHTVVAALHDLNMALAFCDKVIVLKQGQLHHFGDASEVITTRMVKDIYQVPSEIIPASDGRKQLHFNYR